ncbi:MAG: DNA-3-methyladenine glycosylase 2 family protein [Alphaproteobacteria bacterium]|nr:DNA-3-methyladenine glycosylase 2 family protein [Alphaproteobacteria bacterium]
MDPELHRRFAAIAAGISPSLEAHIAAAPIWFPERQDKGVTAFLARAIVGQQLSAKAARSIWTRIETAGGDAFGELFCDTNAALLKQCGLSRNKIKALCHLGAADAAGLLDGAEIRSLDHAARSEQLIQIWGIGQWTCDMLAIFYCRELDIWPEGDLAVVRGLKRFARRRQPNRIAALFAPYRSLLALYMWRLAGAAM